MPSSKNASPISASSRGVLERVGLRVESRALDRGRASEDLGPGRGPGRGRDRSGRLSDRTACRRHGRAHPDRGGVDPDRHQPAQRCLGLRARHGHGRSSRPPEGDGRGLVQSRAGQAGGPSGVRLAFVIGLALVVRGGWPILAIGIASLVAGYAYTGGPRPIAYGPFGELYVLLFFGLAAVGGTYYLQTLTSTGRRLVGIALGLPAAAVLLLNNYRDLETDRIAGRRTLCHHLGRPSARVLYGLLLLGSVAILALHLRPGHRMASAGRRPARRSSDPQARSRRHRQTDQSTPGTNGTLPGGRDGPAARRIRSEPDLNRARCGMRRLLDWIGRASSDNCRSWRGLEYF
jgi:1,4-dihydroxy-2-naphthoate polyprenyltransferase